MLILQKTDIEKAERLLSTAITTGDVNYLEETIDDNLLCLVPSGKIITKAMDLSSHKSGEMSVDKLQLKIEDIRIIGDNAISIVLYETKGKLLGESIEGSFRYIRTWKLMNGKLKVIAASMTAL